MINQLMIDKGHALNGDDVRERRGHTLRKLI